VSSTSDWIETPLDEVCESIIDCVNKTAPRVDYVTPYKMIRTTNVRNGWVSLESVKCVEKEVYEKWVRRQRPEKGDVILTREAPLGEAGMLRSDEKVFLGQRLVSYRANPHKLDNRFLLYGFQGQFLQTQIKALGSGSTVEHMRVPDAKRLKILLPSLKVQREVGAILFAYDDLIENNTRRIKILEEMARRLYEEWFVHFHFPGHEEASFKESELGRIPEEWEVGTLQDVIVLQRGFDLPAKKRTPGDFPVVSATGVSGSHVEAKIDGPGVITGRSGSIGKVMYVHGSYWPLNTTLWGKAFPLGSTLFAFYTLTEIDLKGFNVGAAVPTLNRNDIHGLPVVLPSSEVIKFFDQTVGPIHKLMVTLEKKNANLHAQRDMLLPKLVSGEIDLSYIPKPDDKEVQAA
jgi:type I restriction enzyme S subunit